MTYDPSGLFDAIRDKLAAAGWRHTLIGEPTDPPAQPTASVMFAGTAITETTLGTGSGDVTFVVRFYVKGLQEPRAETEKELARLGILMLEALSGDYDLGDSGVRNVRPLLDSTAGYQTIANVVYRVLDIRVPIFVNDIVSYAR